MYWDRRTQFSLFSLLRYLLIFAHSMLRVDTTQKGEWLLTKVSVQITSNHCVFFWFFFFKICAFTWEENFINEKWLILCYVWMWSQKPFTSFLGQHPLSAYCDRATDQQYLHFCYCHILTCMQINLWRLFWLSFKMMDIK